MMSLTFSNASRMGRSFRAETVDLASWVYWGALRTGTGCGGVCWKKRRKHRQAVSVFWLFISGGREPEREAQLGWGWFACEAENLCWQNRRLLDSPRPCWSAACTLLAVTVFTRSSSFGCHIFGLCSHPKPHPSP